jgi:hypothetical protein
MIPQLASLDHDPDCPARDACECGAQGLREWLERLYNDERQRFRVRDEYQRFYDFVADSDQSIVDAWHFTENSRAANRKEPI